MNSFNHKTLQSLLENMEQAAHTALREDSSFFEALQVLKWEIDSDRRVRAAVGQLEASGRSVFSSFVPQIRIRISNGERVLALPIQHQAASDSGAAQDEARLTLELKDAASCVIANSHHRRELDTIVNEALQASREFEQIASAIENAGYKLIICLDLSAYAQVRGRTAKDNQPAARQMPLSLPQPAASQFSDRDLRFLKALRITT